MPCRTAIPVLALLLGAMAAALPTRAADPPATLRLEDALTLALERAPALALYRSDLTAAEGEVTAARTYPYNPELEIEGADRRGPEGSVTDRGLSLAQELELAGQRSKRRAAAGDSLEAARASYLRRRSELAARVESAFAGAVAARERLEVARTDAELTRRLVEFENRRLEAGAGTQLDLNLARAVAGRAERALSEAEGVAIASRTDLAELIGLDPARPPQPEGTFPETSAPAMSLEDLVTRAVDRRSDLHALRQEVEASRKRIELARSLGKPNLRVGGFVAREEGDDITGLSVGVGIPLFDRNQGGIARAVAARDNAIARLGVARQAVRREVAEALAHYRFAREALTALDHLVVGTLEQSLTLLDRAFESGKVGITEVLVQRRELVAARLEHVDAAAKAWLARIELDLATGDAPVPPAESTETRGEEVADVR